MVPLFTRSPRAGSKLARRRGAEPAAHAGPHEAEAAGELAVHRRPEVVEVLDADGGAERPVGLGAVQLDIAVVRDVAPAPGARGHRPVAEEPVRPGREALPAAVGADRPRLGIARGGPVLLVAPLRPGRDVDHVGGGVGQVGVETDAALPVAAEIELGRGCRDRGAALPPPSPKRPVLYSNAPPEAASSTCRSAMAGMAEMSGPWEPNATPLPPCQSMIDDRCRRLTLTSTSVWSGSQVAQHRRPDDGGGVADRLGIDANDGDHGPKLILQVDGPLAGELAGREHVHQHRQRRHRPRLGTGADDDSFLGEPGQQVAKSMSAGPVPRSQGAAAWNPIKIEAMNAAERRVTSPAADGARGESARRRGRGPDVSNALRRRNRIET